RLLSPDPLSLAAEAIGAGTSLLIVTLAAKGAAYVAAPGFDGWAVGRLGGQAVGSLGRGSSDRLTSPTARPPDRPTAALRTALIPAPAVDVLDPTGCGDVFGAAAAARLFAGDQVEAAIRHANGLAARNAAFRGAGGLSRHLRGQLVLP
ncbi:MAG TPA: PfkB family carbohydrate kinase, partial [Gemmatimonadales bacterium]|nr:PfkB family carbohydrate kinase [Gemmatimonadales bacterium]